VYLMEMVPPGVGAGRLPFGSRIAGPSVGLARSRPHLVPTMRAAGHRVYAWTVNHADEVDLLVGQGVDGLITDRPGFVLNHLG
jgi:glycerophosphoryl diester phosphodiesterase